MGEILKNGVYLPDEGERNAYNGLKSNWNTVDTVVAQVQALSSAGLIRKAVDELPTEDIETNVIYMLKAVKPDNTVYRIEYMYIDNHWDALGTSETTLENYYTKAETDDLPAVKSGVNATKVSNYDTHLANSEIHVTAANKQTWDGKQNALDTAQTAAVNSGVTAAKVTGYDTHVSDTDVHVTASDKTAWNGKQDGLSQTQLAAVNSGVTGTKVTGYDNHVADTDVHVTTTDKAAWNGKQNALSQTQLDNIAAVPDKANSADLATVATTGDYGDLLNAPTIPTLATVATSGEYSDLNNIPASFTPSSHTHTKTDVTDLFNSVNTWTAQINQNQGDTNYYNVFTTNAVKGDLTTNGSFDLLLKDKTNGNISSSGIAIVSLRQDSEGSYAGFQVDTIGSTDNTRHNATIALRISPSTNNNSAEFVPGRTEQINLGSSSYQWNNLYAKSYYYNGTEFQSKFVTLDTEQLITGLKRLKSGWWRLQAANLKVGAGESYGRTGYSLIWTDKDDITICDIASYKQSQAARTYLRLQGGDYYTNGVPDASGTLVQSVLRIGTLANGSRMIECATDAVYPITDGDTDLGSSTNRWKTLNGVNPGTLSLPDYNNYLDVTSSIPVASLDGSTTIDLNDYLPNKTGWLSIVIADTAGNSIIATQGKAGTASGYNASRSFHCGEQGNGYISLFMPLISEAWKSVFIKASSLVQMRFYYCLGHV